MFVSIINTNEPHCIDCFDNFHCLGRAVHGAA